MHLALALCLSLLWTDRNLAQDTARADKPTGIVAPIEPAVVDFTAPGPLDAGVQPRVGLGHVTGKGVGYRESFSVFEGFVPFHQQPCCSLAFADLRYILDNDAQSSANLGGGFRVYSPKLDRVFGLNAYFDHRDTGPVTFQQVGAGFEVLGARWDLRGNCYLPVGDDHKLAGQFLGNQRSQRVETFSNPTFRGSNIIFDHFLSQTVSQDRLRVFQTALSGFDLEAGAPVPGANNLLKAYVGTYYYEADGGPEAWGVRGRLQANISENLALHLAVTDDRVFNTNVVFQVALTFPGVRSQRRGNARCVPDRLGDPVMRNYQVVVTEKRVQDTVSQTTTVTDQVVATDPATGQPIIVRHANSAAAPGGDGTVERPFQNLPQLQAGSAPGNILFVHADSVFPAQFITLQANQRFLGEGIPHTFVSQQGTFLLPRATAGTALPVIPGPVITVITLADNNEVSGFRIAGPNISPIAGTNITNFNINRNTFTGPSIDVIKLTNAGGVGFITDNTLTGPSITGINYAQANTNTRVNISGNRIAGALFGIDATIIGASEQVLGITGNDLTGSIINGVRITDASALSDICLRLQNNTSTGVPAYFLVSTPGGVFDAENTFGTNTGAVLPIGPINLVAPGSCPVP